MMFTKISGVLLATLLLILGLKELAHIVYHPHELEEPAYHIEVPEDLGAGAPAEEEGPVDFGVLVAAADPADGEAVARKCLACHTFEAGGPVVTGPNLHDVLGREAGTVPGFAYSDAMANYDAVWSYENMYNYLENPRAYLPGTAMIFAGLPRQDERIAMLAYLRSLSPNPPPLPEPLPEVVEEEGEEGEAAPTDEAAAGPDYGAMLANADIAAGEASARICLACHTFNEGGPIITGPNLHDIYGRDIAAVDGFAYSDAMRDADGAWTVETLDPYLADPRAYVPGTNMIFAGVPNEQDRINMIAWMHSLNADAPALPEPRSAAADAAEEPAEDAAAE